MIRALRLNVLKPGVFSRINSLKSQMLCTGKDVIDLSVGSPDMAPASHIKSALLEAVANDSNYGYTLTEGLPQFKEAVTQWYKTYYNVLLDPNKEVLPLMGSQDGLTHIYWALLNPGDIALVPDPGYPIYSDGARLAGGIVYPMPLLEENNYLPDLSQIPKNILKKSKIIILNYPSNPLAATATKEFFEEVIDFAHTYNIVVCHDFAYSELSYDGYKNISFLELPGAKEVGVEFHSISKTYNLAGCRLGFVSGNPEVIAALRLIKSNIDYGSFRPIHLAATAALSGSQDCVRQNALAYEKRRDVLVDELANFGWYIKKPKASMFVWAKIPIPKFSAEKFATNLLLEKGVAVVPGIAFGDCGEGYLRIGLVQDQSTLKEAGKRMGEFLSTSSL